jgi:hypothetical protein
LALIVPPIRGFFLLGGGSYFNSPIFRPFFLAIIWNFGAERFSAFQVEI